MPREVRITTPKRSALLGPNTELYDVKNLYDYYKISKNEKVLNFELSGEIIRVPIYQIRYADVFGNYVTIHATQDITVKMTLGDLEKQLDERLLRDFEELSKKDFRHIAEGLLPRKLIPVFMELCGVSKANSSVDYAMLEYCIREDLKLKTNRIMAVKKPLLLVIDNYPEGQIEYLDAMNNTENEELGSRKVAFGKRIYIEQEDFVLEKPNKHYKRLALGIEVRLYHAYFVKAESVVYNEDGSIKEVHCTYDPQTKSGSGFNERKPNGTIHFVEASTAKKATFNLFNPLIWDATEETKHLSFIERLNKNSWEVVEGFVEASLENTEVGTHYQFVRNGYYCTDKLSTKEHLVFNRTCGLKSSFKL